MVDTWLEYNKQKKPDVLQAVGVHFGTNSMGKIVTSISMWHVDYGESVK